MLDICKFLEIYLLLKYFSFPTLKLRKKSILLDSVSHDFVVFR